MKSSTLRYVSAAMGLALIGAFLLILSYAHNAHANVITQGIIPRIASDAVVAVGPQQPLTLASAVSNCTSRVVSTASTSLMLSFSSSLIASSTAGHYQAASTTVSYDNGQYGCGAISAWASASSTVTVAAFVQ